MRQLGNYVLFIEHSILLCLIAFVSKTPPQIRGVEEEDVERCYREAPE